MTRKIDQLLSTIDPVVADTPLTAARTDLKSVTSLHFLKQAQLAFSSVLHAPDEEIIAQEEPLPEMDDWK